MLVQSSEEVQPSFHYPIVLNTVHKAKSNFERKKSGEFEKKHGLQDLQIT